MLINDLNPVGALLAARFCSTSPPRTARRTRCGRISPRQLQPGLDLHGNGDKQQRAGHQLPRPHQASFSPSAITGATTADFPKPSRKHPLLSVLAQARCVRDLRNILSYTKRVVWTRIFAGRRRTKTRSSSTTIRRFRGDYHVRAALGSINPSEFIQVVAVLNDTAPRAESLAHQWAVRRAASECPRTVAQP